MSKAWKEYMLECQIVKEEIAEERFFFDTQEEMVDFFKNGSTALNIKPDFVIVDGDCIKECSYPHECVVKGDAKSLSIAAASILAKVSRDRKMLEMAEKYPQYGFEKHKGYGTKVHIEALKEFGASEIHRKTFIKKFV